MTSTEGDNRWTFPPLETATPEGLIGVGADLEPATLLGAYAHGIFPMPVQHGGELGWWSPDPRGVVPLEGFRRSRSMVRSARRLRTSINESFSAVVSGCADPIRPHGWITPEMIEAYERLHRAGRAHSVEVWDADDALVGGLYGVAIGGFFAAESKFHRATDASKVALARLVDELTAAGDASGEPMLLDIQWCTPHLASLGAVEIGRSDYVRRLEEALGSTCPAVFRR